MSGRRTSGGASRKGVAGKAQRKTLGSKSKAPKAKVSKSKSAKSTTSKNAYRGGNRAPKNMKTPGWQKGIKEFLSAKRQDGAGPSSDLPQPAPQDSEEMVDIHDPCEVVMGADREKTAGTKDQGNGKVFSADEEKAEPLGHAELFAVEEGTVSIVGEADQDKLVTDEGNVEDESTKQVDDVMEEKANDVMEVEAEDVTEDKADVCAGDPFWYAGDPSPSDSPEGAMLGESSEAARPEESAEDPSKGWFVEDLRPFWDAEDSSPSESAEVLQPGERAEDSIKGWFVEEPSTGWFAENSSKDWYGEDSSSGESEGAAKPPDSV